MPTPFIIVAILVILVVVFVQMVIILSRYTKVGPNQVMIVSGRRRQLPDGTSVGYRIVKAGGTFVFPVVEQAQILSLEVMKINASKVRTRTSDGVSTEVDCVAQVKIKGDDASIVAAAEHFLSKSKTEMENALRAVLENQLGDVVSELSREIVSGDTKTFTDQVRSSAAVGFAKMGLTIVSLAIEDVRTR